MSGFSSDWLTSREPIDQRSRNRDILAAMRHYFRDRPSITVIDLAAGRGSLLRALTARLPQRQDWHLVDDDRELLQEATRAPRTSVLSHVHLVDLADAIEDILTIRADLVASSAFIDLVSDAWLDRLVRGATAIKMPVYLALSYDGRMVCEPRHPLDDIVLTAFNRHQQVDKGLGVALGPTAGETAARKFAIQGYDVTTGPADWQLKPAEGHVQRMMVDGWHAAVAELGVIERAALEQWRNQHLTWIDDRRSTMTVGHVDLWAVPP